LSNNYQFPHRSNFRLLINLNFSQFLIHIPLDGCAELTNGKNADASMEGSGALAAIKWSVLQLQEMTLSEMIFSIL
jgi:hypothetical protein